MKRSAADERFTSGNEVDQGLDIWKEWAALQPLDATVNRPPPIMTPEDEEAEHLANFDAYVRGPAERARQSGDSSAFMANLTWLGQIYPDGARRYADELGVDELDRLVDPRQPGSMTLLNTVTPGYVQSRLDQAQADYEAAIRQQGQEQWGVMTFDDLHFSDMARGGSVYERARSWYLQRGNPP